MAAMTSCEMTISMIFIVAQEGNSYSRDESTKFLFPFTKIFNMSGYECLLMSICLFHCLEERRHSYKSTICV